MLEFILLIYDIFLTMTMMKNVLIFGICDISPQEKEEVRANNWINIRCLFFL